MNFSALYRDQELGRRAIEGTGANPGPYSEMSNDQRRWLFCLISHGLESLRESDSFSIQDLSSLFIGPPISPSWESVPERKVDWLLLYLKRLSQIAFSEQLARRIEYLYEEASAEEGIPPLNPSSLGSMIGFLESEPKLNYPSVVLSPAGNLRAEWSRSHNQHFVVEFLDDDRARFVVFAPEHKHPEQTLRVSGIVAVEELMERVENFGVREWAEQEKTASHSQETTTLLDFAKGLISERTERPPELLSNCGLVRSSCLSTGLSTSIAIPPKQRFL